MAPRSAALISRLGLLGLRCFGSQLLSSVSPYLVPRADIKSQDPPSGLGVAQRCRLSAYRRSTSTFVSPLHTLTFLGQARLGIPRLLILELKGGGPYEERQESWRSLLQNPHPALNASQRCHTARNFVPDL
jgi:hypothetical protein